MRLLVAQDGCCVLVSVSAKRGSAGRCVTTWQLLRCNEDGHDVGKVMGLWLSLLNV